MRSFGRLVTERVGALQDDYLGRRRPLGAARVLWEVGDNGSELREVRGRLGLDSGYLSRLLRSLEAERLVRVEPSEHDRRVRTVRLTAAGRRECERLDRRSDALARSMVEGLGELQRARLVAAMADVERLLIAAMVEIEVVDPARSEASYCLREYFSELDRRFEHGYVHPGSVAAELEGLRPPAGVFLLATLRSEPVGCGTLTFGGSGVAELKRLWVSASVRGLGLGRRMLEQLEREACLAGASSIRLDTNRALTEAISLYRSAGYEEIERFSGEPYAHHWFGKRLVP